MPKLAANLTMTFAEVPFLERFAAAARAGFRGVEFLFPYDYDAAVLFNALVFGIASLAAQWLLRRPLIAANTREFHVTGSWDDPKIDRIERKPPEAASTTGTQ